MTNRHVPLLAWIAALMLSLSALLNSFFVFQQIMIYKDLDDLNSKLSQAPQLQTMIQNLANDLVVYGQKQSNIYSVIKKYGINPPPQPQSR